MLKLVLIFLVIPSHKSRLVTSCSITMCYVCLSAVKTQTVRVKLNQLSKRVIVYATTHRTFGKQQWQLLRDQLDTWQGNLQQVLASLQQLVVPGPR